MESINQRKGATLRKQFALMGLTVLAAAVLATPAQAAEKPIYLGGGLAVETVPGYDDGYGLVFRGGYKLDQVLPGFSVEGELTRSLVDPETPGGTDVTFTSLLGAYAVYTAPLPNRRVALRGRLGLAYVDEDWPGSGADNDDLWFSWGLGAELRITSGLSAYADYTRKSSRLDQLNLGALVHF